MYSAGTAPAYKEYTADSVPENKECTAGNLKYLKFQTNSHAPSKYPLVRPQNARIVSRGCGKT